MVAGLSMNPFRIVLDSLLFGSEEGVRKGSKASRKGVGKKSNMRLICKGSF